MFCTNCGAQLDDDSKFCTSCGNPISEDVSERVSEADLASAPAGNAFMAGDGAIAGESAVPQKGGNKTAVIVAVVALVAIIAVAAIAFLMLRPTAANAVTVQYETDGGTAIAAVEVEEGAQVTSPANPTKNGYDFAGWYSNPERTDSVTFPFIADGDVMLYAKWEEKPAESPTPSTSSSAATAAVPSVPNNAGSTVSVTIVGADGTARTASIRRSGSTERVLPDGNARRYSASELAGLSDAERCIAWNEIIAYSNGYAFKNSGLANYFNSCSWYHRDVGASASGSLTSDASANVELLKSGLSDNWWLTLATY